MAMYRAKLTEGSHINVFDSRLEAEVAERLDLDAALRRALERDQLRLAAQPVVMLDTGAITGFELLLHWRRPGLPVLSPGTFIPLAEDNGMIVDIGRWVLQQAVAQLAEWRAAGLAQGLTISVNVSARQVRDPDFADEVLALLISEQVPPESLVIELTEHALIDLRLAHPPLTRLRDAGVQVSLDDFGTGYSSLTQLRTLPVDQIKLDRSFTAALDEGSPKQQAVVESVVALANALALDLVIEGVETLTEREALLRAGASKGRASCSATRCRWTPRGSCSPRARCARLPRHSPGCSPARGSDYTVPASSAAPSPSVSTSLRSHRPSPSVST